MTFPRLGSTVVRLLSLTAGLGLMAGAMLQSAQGERATVIPPPAADAPASDARSEVAVFAGGCFWGVQAVFQHTKGVTSAVSGYAGGEQATARYDRIGEGDTGHAESVQVTYDPRQVSYGQLLQVFFSVAHDPTQRDRQGPDVGPQYRSAIFPASAEQERVAAAYIAQLNAAKVFPREHRHAHRAEPPVLPRRGVPPGLPGAESPPALHRVQRPAEAGRTAARVPGSLSAPSRCWSAAHAKSRTVEARLATRCWRSGRCSRGPRPDRGPRSCPRWRPRCPRGGRTRRHGLAQADSTTTPESPLEMLTTELAATVNVSQSWSSVKANPPHSPSTSKNPGDLKV